MELTPRRSLELAAAISIILILGTAYYWPIEDAYHPLNYTWDGCSIAAQSAHSLTLIHSYDNLPFSSRALLLIVGPGRTFSRADANHIMQFINSGGVGLLADDFGTGNELLQLMGVPARFSNETLADLLYYSRDPRFPLIYNFSTNPITNNVSSVLLTSPSFIVIENSSNVAPLALSSSFSFVDYQRDGHPAPNETVKAYPVIAEVTIGNGSLVLVSDPHMFVNEIIGLFDNLRLLQNALDVGGSSLLFDVSHLTTAPLTNGRALFRNLLDSMLRNLTMYRENPVVQLLVVVVLIAGFYAGNRIRMGRKGKLQTHKRRK